MVQLLGIVKIRAGDSGGLLLLNLLRVFAVLRHPQVRLGHMMKCVVEIEIYVVDRLVLGPQVNRRHGLAFCIPQRQDRAGDAQAKIGNYIRK